jgi:sterol desaturase/sphingolipid hydroxylase (fatty acid hydroxylase superfamily)
MLYFLIGLVVWSLFEYLLHRYIFHIAENAFRGSKRLQYLLHGVHHEYPNDAQRTLMPFLPKLIISAFFLSVFCLILRVKGCFFSSGFITGYYLYSMIHYSIHRFKAPRYLQFLWLHHHVHHHQQDDKAYGVSSRFWDKIFGTMPVLQQKKRDVEV